MEVEAIALLRNRLNTLMTFGPGVIRNVFYADDGHPPRSLPSTHQEQLQQQFYGGAGGSRHRSGVFNAFSAPPPSAMMAEAVEAFITDLYRVLSLHLRSTWSLWSVFELLQCVPHRMAAAAEQRNGAVASVLQTSTPPRPSSKSLLSSAPSTWWSSGFWTSPGIAEGTPAAASPLQASVDRSQLVGCGGTAKEITPASDVGAPSSDDGSSRLHRYRFATQLLYVVRTTFPHQAPPVLARIFLRLALNQGCLLASLELLRVWCTEELGQCYESGNTATTTSTTGSSDSCSRLGMMANGASKAVLVQPETEGDLWCLFVAAIAPVAGPLLSAIECGAPKESMQPFMLQLYVADLDEMPLMSDTSGTAAVIAPPSSSSSPQSPGPNFYSELLQYCTGDRAEAPSAWQWYQQNGAAKAAAVIRGSRDAKNGESADDTRAAEQFHVVHVEQLPTKKKKKTKRSKGSRHSVHHSQYSSNAATLPTSHSSSCCSGSVQSSVEQISRQNTPQQIDAGERNSTPAAFVDGAALHQLTHHLALNGSSHAEELLQELQRRAMAYWSAVSFRLAIQEEARMWDEDVDAQPPLPRI